MIPSGYKKGSDASHSSRASYQGCLLQIGRGSRLRPPPYNYSYDFAL